tara:strand:+ start:2012 stop:3367 length:1356 start_codon:yes stop_codon:yes gene_type:complete
MRLCPLIVLFCALPATIKAGESEGWRPRVVMPPVRKAAHGQVKALPDGMVDPARPRTLSEFLALAESRHPMLRINSARINEARGDHRQAGLWPNPVVGYRGEEMGNQGTPGMQGGFIRQKIITGQKLKLASSVAAARVREREHLATMAREQVVGDVRVRFYDTLVAQQRVELTSQLSKLGRELARATAMLVQAKQVSRNGLYQAEIASEQAAALRENSENELKEARRLLALSVGVTELKVGLLEGKVTSHLTDMTWEECRSRVLADHPGLAAARTRLTLSNREIARQKRLVVPDLDVRVGMAHMYTSDSDVTSVMVGVPLPIFDRNQGGISRSEAGAVRARFEVERMEVELEQRAASAYREYSNARHQARRYSEKILPRARKSIETVKEGYREGQVRYLELLLAQQKFVEVNLAYLSTIRKLRESVTVIESRLLSGGLHGHRIGRSASSRR